MKVCIAIVGLLMVAGLSTGCISHNMGTDYAQYLAKSPGRSQLPSTKLEADYALTRATESHKCKVRAASAGLANAWIVEFGKILDMQLQSRDVQEAFGKLARQRRAGNDKGNLITFDLEQYSFHNFGAHIRLKISLANAGVEAISKTYESSGRAQGGKVSWGGAFAMRNAIQQSTKLAIDEILADFIKDVTALPAAAGTPANP